MAKPYKEGARWSFRLRLKEQDIYETGFPTAAAARKAMESHRRLLTAEGRPAHAGPWCTSLAAALSQYARERLPALKGARQVANRINKYLRAASLPTLRIVPVDSPILAAPPPKGATAKAPETIFCRVELVRADEPRKVANSLADHRNEIAQRTESSDKVRALLATREVAEIATYDLQKLMDAMHADGLGNATVTLERALLRHFFNYAASVWNWPAPQKNPAVKLVMKSVDNQRTRILSNAEFREIDKGLNACKSPYIAPAVYLLLESAMRCSEALMTARWRDYDATRNILTLRDAKAGAREVPLTPEAVAVLEMVRDISEERGKKRQGSLLEPDARILPISYEALKAGWRRACQQAGVEDIRLHDLRHTSATRFSLEFHGNVPVLKVITGHKTSSQLERYINVKPDDVAALLHGKPLSRDNGPAALKHLKTPSELSELSEPPEPSPAFVEDVPLPSNVLELARYRKAA